MRKEGTKGQDGKDKDMIVEKQEAGMFVGRLMVRKILD